MRIAPRIATKEWKTPNLEETRQLQKPFEVIDRVVALINVWPRAWVQGMHVVESDLLYPVLGLCRAVQDSHKRCQTVSTSAPDALLQKGRKVLNS